MPQESLETSYRRSRKAAAFAALLILCLVLLGASRDLIRQDHMMAIPQDIVGGHSPHGYADYMESAPPGLYNVMQNLTPLDATPGALLPRRSIQWVSRFDTSGAFIDTAVVNWSYLTSARTVNNRTEGIFLFQRNFVSNEVDSIYGFKKYYEERTTRLDTSEMDQATFTPAVWSPEADLPEPGYGDWVPSVSQPRIWMAGGRVRRDSTQNHFDEGGPVSCYFQFFDWDSGAVGGYEGLMWNADDNHGLQKSQYAVVPEKPWTDLGLGWKFYSGYNFPVDENDNGWAGENGEAFWGNYLFWICPVDVDGEVGPPLKASRLHVPMGLGIGGAWPEYWQGTMVGCGIEEIVPDSIRPSIAALNIYGKYTNPDVGANYWQDLVERDIIDIPPIDREGLVATIDLNGRQFDPEQGEYMPAQGGAVQMQRSPRFNYFNDYGTDDGWIQGAWQAGQNNVRLWHNLTPVDNYAYRMLTYWVSPAESSDSVYIEIENYGGVWQTDGWTNGTDPSQGNYTEISLVDNFPAALVGNTVARLRFCFPWQKNAADDYEIHVWSRGPEFWDETEVMPFPEYARADYSEGYYFYEKQAINPSDTRRLAWGYQPSAFWDTDHWEVDTVEDVLLYTTNNVNGDLETKHFGLGVAINGNITGAAFIDDDRFIVSTREKSYYAQFVQHDGQWVVEIVRDLPYGNSAKNLTAFNESVYGLDNRYGLWVAGVDNARIRTDVDPLGDQRLLFNSMQVDWFFTNYGARDGRLSETKIVVTPEQVLLNFPLMAFTDPPITGPQRGGFTGGYNVVRDTLNNGGDSDSDPHHWLSLYRSGAGMLDYEFSRKATSADYIAILDPIIGPHGQVFFHQLDNDFFAFNRVRANHPLDILIDKTYAPIHWALETSFSAPGFPEQIATINSIYTRVAPRGQLIAQTIKADATDQTNGYLTLWDDPRGKTVQWGVVEGDTVEQGTDFSLSGNVISPITWSITTDSSYTFAYYANLDYDIDVTHINQGNEDTTISRDANMREGRVNYDGPYAEYFKVLMHGNSVEPANVRGISAFLEPGRYKDIFESSATTDDETGSYGVFDTGTPVIDAAAAGEDFDDTLYVAPFDFAGGTDSGSVATPFTQISNALDSCANRTSGENILVYVEDGLYRQNILNSTLFGSGVSVTLRGDTTEMAILTGAEDYKDSTWTDYDGGDTLFRVDYDNAIGYAEGRPAWPSADGTVQYQYDYATGDPLDAIDTLRAEILTRRDGVYINATRMRQVASWDSLLKYPFSVFVDTFAAGGTDSLYLHTYSTYEPTDATVKRIEVVTRTYGIYTNAEDLTVENFNIVNFRNGCRMEGISGDQPENITFNNVHFMENTWYGASWSYADSLTFNRCSFTDNGLLGTTNAFSVQALFDSCRWSGNNWRGALVGAYDWYLAGFKNYAVYGYTWTNCEFDNNWARGLWFDRACAEIGISNSRFVTNYKAGLFLEISVGPFRISDSDFITNGHQYDPVNMELQKEGTTDGNGLTINCSNNIHLTRCDFINNGLRNIYIANDERTYDGWTMVSPGETDVPITNEDLYISNSRFFHRNNTDNRYIVLASWISANPDSLEAFKTNALADGDRITPDSLSTAIIWHLDNYGQEP